jgi:protein-tyrosine phosphatase
MTVVNTQQSLHHLPHKLPFQGANNFRDMGGYPCRDGRCIKPGKVFRSDHLGSLTADDQRLIEQLGIKTIVDLRRKRERAENLDRIDDEGIKQIWLPVDAQGADVHELKRRLEDGSMSEQDARNHLLEANREFVRDFSHIFKRFMDVLLDEQHYPLVFHCTAGKDRAGFAAAMFLVTAGASRETVFHDYLSTNQCTSEFLGKILENLPLMPEIKASPGTVSALLQVEAAYLEEAFTTIDLIHGSLDNFLEQALQMPPARQALLQSMLCE